MRRYYAAAIVLACMLGIVASYGVSQAKPMNFQAQLSGLTEFPPVKTPAKGEATFQLNGAGDELSFKLTVSNIENVTDAHIHIGSKADSLGQRLVTLYGGPLRQGQTQGTLVTGTIKRSDLKGPLMDQPMSALVALFTAGLAFVDVHTEQYPAGEIRGEIR